MNLEILEFLGMSKSESKAYFYCFKLGSTTASEIAKQSGLNRSNCYEALEKLISKGLIASIKKDKKTYFEAANPRNLREILKSNEKKLDNFIIDLEKYKPENISKKQKAVILEGYSGIKVVFEDIIENLDKDNEYLVLGAVDVPDVFERYIIHWTKIRIKKKIRMRIIYNTNAKSFIEQTKKLALTEIRILPKEYVTPAVVNIYKNKTATIVWTKKPIAFVVDNQEYTDSFRNYFNALWKIAKK